MKLFKSLLLTILVVGTLNSCKKDEPIEVVGLQENILGVWKSDAKKMLNNGEVTRYNYVAFNENGICTFWQSDYENGSLRSIEEKAYFEWYANGDKGISIYWPSGAIDIYYITINGDKMSVSTGSMDTYQSRPFYIDTDNGISTWNRQN